MEVLNISSCNLAGTNLIEASAGTGKTYTITGLFIRLIVEKNISPEKILVVTFTRAAVDELRDRLYKALQAARDCFSGDAPSSESFINVLREDRSLAPAEKIGRITSALRNFDECAIYTIHGFCQRMLLENVFAGGSLYDTELISDQSEMLLEAVQDFWRTHIYQAPRFVMGRLLQKGLDFFTDLYRFKERNPDLHLAVPAELPKVTDLENNFVILKKLCQTLKEQWPVEPLDTIAWFELERNLLDRKSYQERYIVSAARVIDQYCRSSALIIDKATREKLTKFTSSELVGKSKNDSIPQHPFFTLADKVAAQYDLFKELEEGYLIYLKTRMFDYVNTRLAERKKRDNSQSFNDFIIHLRQSLTGTGGTRLVHAVRRRFTVALIDEFQDTDPSQYAIFSTLFSASTLFLIGDPKQAIYSFRGADVYAYLRAAANVRHRCTLATNYRSDNRLVQAINGIFDKKMSDNPFAEPSITFQPVEAAIKDSRLVVSGEENRAALTIWTIDHSITEDKAITATAARRYINQAVLTEIHRLLTLAAEGRAKICQDGRERPLRPADFAVLTRSKKEMAPLRNLLSSHGIPCVTSSADSIFDTREAGEMELLLKALAEPGKEEYLKSALAQPLFGLDGRKLQEMAADPFTWGKWTLAFKDYHDLFQNLGFLGMFRVIIRENEIKKRLLSLRGGERHLTNLQHLAETIQQQQNRTGAGLMELLNWFSICCADPLRREEEFELRIESDDNAVRIVTIHKSKGMEYPIVFAPFVWSRSENSNKICHDKQGAMTLFLDQRQFAEQQAAAFREAMSENLRLFYVALTRARHRCYTFWTKLTHHSKSHTSAPAYLFLKGDQLLAKPDPARAMKKAYDKLKDINKLKKHMIDKLAHVREYVTVETLPFKVNLPILAPGEEHPTLEAATFPGRIRPAWRLASFSFLSRESHDLQFAGAKESGQLKLPPPEKRQENEFTIFTFPRGARPGTFLHEMLEYLDYRGPFDRSLEQTIIESLEKYGFNPGFAPAIKDMLRNVVNQPLDGFSLSGIKKEQRLNEMEFYFPLKKISPTDLAAIFSRSISEDQISAMFRQQAEGLIFSPVHGYMHGFIDLVFAHEGRYYLIDWKSNYLGDRVEDYNREALNQAMSASFYFLQYHIYTLALHLYLQSRLPGYNYAEHFGGVYYLFLRGIAPPDENGIYFHKPALRVIEEMAGLVRVQE